MSIYALISARCGLPFSRPPMRAQTTIRCRRSVALFVLICVQSTAQTAAHALPEHVDSLLEPWNQPNEPGTAVLLIRDGKVEYRKGFGLADLSRGTAITADTQFQLESVSKQFTAMGIMILAQRRKLRYDDSLSKFCPEFPAYALPLPSVTYSTTRRACKTTISATILTTPIISDPLMPRALLTSTQRPKRCRR